MAVAVVVAGGIVAGLVATGTVVVPIVVFEAGGPIGEHVLPAFDFGLHAGRRRAARCSAAIEHGAHREFAVQIALQLGQQRTLLGRRQVLQFDAEFDGAIHGAADDAVRIAERYAGANQQVAASFAAEATPDHSVVVTVVDGVARLRCA